MGQSKHSIKYWSMHSQRYSLQASPILHLVMLIHQDGKGGLWICSDTGDHRPHSSCCPTNLLCSCIGIYFYWHSHSVEAFHSQQYLHLLFPFKEVKWSQDDLLRLIHSLENVPLVNRMVPVNDVEPAITNWKKRNWSTKALIPCGNWTQVIEQLHSQNF